MILRPEPFLPGRQSFPLRADDLNNLADAVNRAGKLTGSGIAYATAGNNPSVYVAQRPRQMKGFWARVSIPIETNSTDYTDERYYVYRIRATGGPGVDDQITTEDDLPPPNDDGDPNEPWPLTATNRAEKAGHTHTLTDGMEVWVTGEADWSENPVVHYSFAAQPPAGVTVKDCADAPKPVTTIKFRGGFSRSDPNPASIAFALNIVPDPAHPGILIDYNPDSCTPMKLGLDCNAVIQDVKYVAGVFYKTVCGIDYVVFSTTACPTAPGAPSAEFFAYNN